MNSIRVVLAPLDVEFPLDGGVTAIFGPSGAGKTRLLESIAGLAKPSGGRILLNDAILFDAAAGVHLVPQRRRCAFIPQSPSLFPGMSPRSNLELAAKRLPRLERHRHVNEIIEKFHLTEDSPHFRWAIARALVTEPKLLLIDDCGIDPDTLLDLREHAACPVLLASRDLDLCCAADNLIAMQNGRILQRGAPSRVLDQPESLEAARLLGFRNLFQATLGVLDPGRNRSILEFEHFSLGGPYIPGHFRGDRVWVAVAPDRLRAYSTEFAPKGNCIELDLERAIPQARTVDLEFAFGVVVRTSSDDYARQQDNRSWRVEFPPEALRIL